MSKVESKSAESHWIFIWGECEKRDSNEVITCSVIKMAFITWDIGEKCQYVSKNVFVDITKVGFRK